MHRTDKINHLSYLCVNFFCTLIMYGGVIIIPRHFIAKTCLETRSVYLLIIIIYCNDKQRRWMIMTNVNIVQSHLRYKVWSGFCCISLLFIYLSGKDIYIALQSGTTLYQDKCKQKLCVNIV